MIKGLPGVSWLSAPASPLRGALGHLERDVMDVIWSAPELPVRDVQARLRRTVAYTTVMTTLDRLYKKGYVRRRLDGRAFVYAAAFAREEMEARMAAGLLQTALAEEASARPLLSNLVDAVGDRADGLLDELERLVREKRRQIKREQR